MIQPVCYANLPEALVWHSAASAADVLSEFTMGVLAFGLQFGR